jgi:signal peptidase II
MTAIVVIAGAIVVLDQVTKAIALQQLAPGVAIPVIDGVLSLTLVMNTGLAFGLLAGLPATWRWLVALSSIVALIVLARVAARVLAGGGWPARLSVALIFGGAVGNLIDRARFGAVVDFVDAHYRGYHWPAFNVADSGITVGVVLLALHLMLAPSGQEADRPHS